jgi:hypothetical protein
MQEIWSRIAEDMVARVSGPMHLRIILQPVMALVFATISGLRDAREGTPPYFWSLINNPAHRQDMLQDGWKSVGKVFLIAIALDVVYQITVQRFVYPGEAILVAILLAIVPYLIMRPLVARVVAMMRSS